MTQRVKLVVMGVAGAAMLYSCGPAVTSVSAVPYFWFVGNPFYRPPPVNCPPPPGEPGNCTPRTSSSSSFGHGGDGGSKTSEVAQSQRGGFGATGAHGGS